LSGRSHDSSIVTCGARFLAAAHSHRTVDPAFTDPTDPKPTWHMFMNTMTWESKPLSAMDQVHLVCMQLHDQGKVCTVAMVKSISLENFNKHCGGDRNPFGIFLHAGSLIDEVEVDGLNGGWGWAVWWAVGSGQWAVEVALVGSGGCWMVGRGGCWMVGGGGGWTRTG